MLGPSKYSFWWTPKPVVTGRRSIRAQKGSSNYESLPPYRNVMYDKHIIRGSNYGATSVLAETDQIEKAAQLRRRNALRKKLITRNQRNVLGTPPPVVGRRHTIIQTDLYLEELLEHPTVRTTDTQTDLFLELPPTPPYFITSKTGIDVGTSIEAGDLELQTPQEAETKLEEEPLIERFVEACILETTQEFESEENENKDDIGEEEPQGRCEKENNEAQLCLNLSEELKIEISQVVETTDILDIILKTIIKQQSSTSSTESFENKPDAND